MSDDPTVEALEALTDEFHRVADALDSDRKPPVQKPVGSVVLPQWVAAIVAGTVVTSGLGFFAWGIETNRQIAEMHILLTEIVERRMDAQSERISELREVVDDLTHAVETHILNHPNGDGT